MGARRIGVRGGLLAVVLLVPAWVAAQSPPAPPARLGGFIGVMGEVGRPGVYEYPHQPQLAEVLWYAQGLTPAASRNIRVIREGASGQTTFFSPDSTFPLAAGDIVIAETQRTIPAVPAAAASTPPAAQCRLQIGCVNLLANRPIVLPVPREQATVAEVAAALGQSPQSVVRILQTGAEQVQGPNLANQTLPDGAVLIFDPAQVRLEKIPDLANTFRIDPHNPPAVIPQPYHRQTAAAPPQSLPPSEASFLTVPPSTAMPPGMAPTVSAMRPVPGMTPPPTESQENLFTVTSQPLDSTATAATTSDGGPEAAADGSGTDDSAAAEDDITAAGTATATVAAKENKWDGTLVLLAAGCAAAVAGTVWAAARRFRHGAASPDILPFPEPSRAAHAADRTPRLSLLDALIHDELPMAEEPCLVPTGLQFYGRSAAARRYRMEPAPAEAVIAAPHFAPARVASPTVDHFEPAPLEESESPTVALRVDRDHATARAPHTGRPDASRDLAGAPVELSEQHTASLLDRVLTHIHQTTKPA